MKNQKRANTTAGRDWNAGFNDCTGGFYDKWYRQNRRDKGAAYDAGFNYCKQIGAGNIGGWSVIDCM